MKTEIQQEDKITASSDELLDVISYLRDKKEDLLIKIIIDILIERKVYPAPTKYMSIANKTYFDMVMEWGARWHEYEFPHSCKNCNKSLKNDYLGPPFKMESACLSDNTFSCPFCKYKYSSEEYMQAICSRFGETKEVSASCSDENIEYDNLCF